MLAERPTERMTVGRSAEDLAAQMLGERGYRVKHRNFHCREGEVDIVAESSDTLCFVEVRMRMSDTWGDPALTVSWAKQRRVVRAAMKYLFERGMPADKMIRFDVVSVVGCGPGATLEHIPDAFDAGM